jgi:N-acetylmuramoyl-L-alanine amidase
MIRERGKVSWFGGPDDTGVSPDEGLAFIYDVEDAPHLFLDEQPPGTTGLARRLDADHVYYIALRWDYDITPKESLLDQTVTVRNARTGKTITGVYAADWGPHVDTGRVADISPCLMAALDLTTDDEVEVEYQPATGVPIMPYERIVISSGHGLKVRGACGILDEVDEARKVVERVAEELRTRGVDVTVFHDDVSTSQNENLNRIVDFHNSQTRDLDVSVHFNAYVETEKPMGTEVLYVTQSELAGVVSAAIADAGEFIDRGAKKRTDLFFLNSTEMPSILIETCFVDSDADADCYGETFDAICCAIADVLGGEAEEEIEEPPPDEERPPRPPRPPRPTRPPALPPTVRFDIEVIGDVTVIINGVPVTD